MHGEATLAEITIIALTALGGGILFEKIRQPAVIGYIIAGLLLGPSAFGFVQSREIISILAELGVLLLLFLIGMELDLRKFKQVWHLSVLCTLAQLLITLLVVIVLGTIFGLSFGLCVLMGCAIALSSTAVAVKMMEAIEEEKTDVGRITVGVLIAQDLAIIPIIVVLRSMGSVAFEIEMVTRLLAAIAILVGLMWFLSRNEGQISLPFSKTLKKQKDLLPLLVLGFCFGLAAISGFVGISEAYGAFLAGLILGNTDQHTSLMKATHPLQSTFMMVFFVSIGLLIDISFIWENIGTILILLFVITFGKSLLNISVLHSLGQSWKNSFLSGLLLAQMGEFAFLLVTVGRDAKLIDAFGSQLVITLAALSLTFSPLWLAGARRLHSLAPRSKLDNFKGALDAAFGQEIKRAQEMGDAISKVSSEAAKKIRDKAEK